MKKIFFVLTLLVSVGVANAQKTQKEKFGVYKFHPLGLATSSLVLGREIFNEKNTKSTVITVGIRYKNVENPTNGGSGTAAITQFNKWLGTSVNVERRFYVPSFGEKTGTIIDNKGTWGIYLAPALKIDYNKNSFDKSYNTSVYDNVTKKTITTKVEKIGQNKYLGFTPTANIGLQFTIFQNMYIDLYIGGGIRVLNKTQESLPNNNSSYFGENGLIEEFVRKEGVIPNGGFNIGIRL